MSLAMHELASEAELLAHLGQPAVLHFWAAWCEPCQQVDAVLLHLAADNPSVAFLRVDAEQVDSLTTRFDIVSVPTCVCVNASGVQVGRVDGADAPALVAAVAALTRGTPVSPEKGVHPAAPQGLGPGRLTHLLLLHPTLLFTTSGAEDASAATAASALQAAQVHVHAVDVHPDPELQAAITSRSKSSLFPQLFIRGSPVSLAQSVQAVQQLIAQVPTGTTAAPPPPTTAPLPTVDLPSRLNQLVQQQPIMLFMKGTPDAPRCGFSRKVVDALQSNNLSFGTFDILSDEDVRQGLKELSNWPTFPQLYVKGELMGGCDIVLQMQAEGELAEAIQSSLEA